MTTCIPFVTEGNLTEWVVIDMQGTLTSKAALDSQTLGELKFLTSETVVLALGGHQLEGRVEKLGKPLVVLKKCEQKEGEPLRWCTTGVVNKKIVFKNKSKTVGH